MPAKKLLYLLSREEVKEIALQAGKPPCALVNSAYRRITSNPLTEDEIIAVLAAAGGMEHLPGLPDGRTWEYKAAVGLVRILAAYEDGVLKASMKLVAPAAAAEAATSAARAPSGPLDKAQEKPARASRRPPAAASAEKPARASRRPPAAASAEKPARASRRPPAMQAPRVSMSADASAGEASRAPRRPISRAFSEVPISVLNEVAAATPRIEDPVAAVGGAAPVVITAHDAFNFEPANPWGGGRLPEAPQKRVLPKFDGDLLDDLFGKSREQNASDVHVLADRPPMLRIAGELVAQDYTLESDKARELVLARVPASLRDMLERDGSCDFALNHAAYGRFRVNVTNQRTGIKLTARPIAENVPTLAELGLPESIARATHHHQGLIVITGPTGHGKTTTLAAIVGIINRDTTHHVITVEDPVEFIHPTAKAVISQREVGTHTKTFQAALKGSLREDPDVIVVGELRDTETVRMALTASETGHLVISTMNTPSAAKAIERLIDLFPPGDQPQVRMTLAGGLRLIVSQRLLPNADRTGLCAAAEVLPGNLPLWNLIRENRTYQIASLQQRGKAMGIIRLDESLAELVKTGRTSMEIAKQYAEQPEYFEAIVLGRPVIHKPQEPQPGVGSRPAAQAAQAAKNAAAQVAAATPKKAAELGKTVLSRAGRLFGSDAK